jgi:hypothetical protein
MAKNGLVVIAIGLVLTSCSRSIERAVLKLPASARSVAIERQPMHAHLAEYHRTLILERDGRPVARAGMFDDTGGYSRSNLYRISDTILLVRDAEASYTIDVAKETIVKDEERRFGGNFIGSFDVDASDRWRFISPDERKELPAEFRGG